MKHVLYGILRSEADAAGRVAALTAGPQLRLVSHGDLGAAVSLTADAATAPPGPKVHAQVVQALHSVCTVLPVRHGILLDGESEVYEILRVHGESLRQALDDLQGCEEMGVRVICRPTASPQPCGPAAEAELSPARAYLASRKGHYAGRDDTRQEVSQLAERMKGAFQGLFAKCKTESFFLHDRPMLSLHFLVRREKTKGFRNAFRRLELRAPEKFLLTGPWPPYNFASCENVIGSRGDGK